MLTDRELMQRAILARPDDPLAPLVLADWL